MPDRSFPVAAIWENASSMQSLDLIANAGSRTDCGQAVILFTRDLLMGEGGRTVKFEGGPYHADLSFFLVDMDTGAGPAPHRHPYAEVFVPLDGTVLLRCGKQEVQVGSGTVVVVPGGLRHCFTN